MAKPNRVASRDPFVTLLLGRGAVFLLLGSLAVPGLANAQSSGTGRIEGVVTISDRLITPRMRVRVYDEPGSAPQRLPSLEHRFAGVVVYLKPVDASAVSRLAASGQSRTIPPALRQRDERFSPHVLPIIAGTTVEFPNDDDVFHNVFSLSSARTFDLGRYARGSSRSVLFPNDGVVQVFCHIHADMSAFVLVLDNPHFVIPDAEGRFVLDGVPPGSYQLVAWHERIKPMFLPVRVDAGRATPVRFRIPLPARPGEQ